ncbi:MAG: hypothetical protein IJJ33_18255 [Victivallales bacterium]|nr:hypothetical protein [Victivallales bacterium]
MGGRGSASGVSATKAHIKYGHEYHCVLEYKNIKFIVRNQGAASAPLETMTPGRIYATIGLDNEVNYISFYRRDGKKFKQIDVDHHEHLENGVNLGKRHVHMGYNHDENGSRRMTTGEARLVELVLEKWRNR